MQRNEWVGGAVLIVIGVALLIGQYVGDAGRFVLLGIGLVLLALFFASRNPGTLIGGGIVTGLGAGVLAASSLEGDPAGAAVLFGLGGGFVLVWLIGTFFGLEETRLWPLFPGTILILIGALVLAQADPRLVGLAWPIALIALGVIVIAAGLRRRTTSGPGAAEGPAQQPGPGAGPGTSA